MVDKKFWYYKSVIVTGCSGFIGTWLGEVLNACGARLYGIDKCPSLHTYQNQIVMNIADRYDILINNIATIQPKIIFHFAADPILSNGYVDPHNMLYNNIMSTVNLYTALHKLRYKGVVVNMTTDKVYAPMPPLPYRGYNERSALGAVDPYSCSKVCADMIGTMFYNIGIRTITVRAGNVFGGGDYGKNRLFPYIVKNINNKTIRLRNPNGTRPYQYILNFIDSLLMVVAGESQTHSKVSDPSGIWNIGPTGSKTNMAIALDFISAMGIVSGKKYNTHITSSPVQEFREKKTLELCTDKLYSAYPHTEAVSYHDALEQTAKVYRDIETARAKGRSVPHARANSIKACVESFIGR